MLYNKLAIFTHRSFLNLLLTCYLLDYFYIMFCLKSLRIVMVESAEERAYRVMQEFQRGQC